MQLDLIGDVHGHVDALRALLRKLGYTERGGAWRHANSGRRAVFLGDLVDRGPAQIETVALARNMIEADTALIVMGNHELNAIAFAYPDPAEPGRHFRPRHDDNVRHHSVFLNAVGGVDTPLHRELVEFFLSMPLWLDLQQVRIVHACWSRSAIDALKDHCDSQNRFTKAGLYAALTKGTSSYAACETLLKGPEMILPAGIQYRDAQGTVRSKYRTRWWDATAATLRTACAESSLVDRLPDEPVPAESVIALDETKLLFFGHYWMEGRPFILAPKRTCLDFSVAKGGVLCAYRFDGEPTLDAANLVWAG